MLSSNVTGSPCPSWKVLSLGAGCRVKLSVKFPDFKLYFSQEDVLKKSHQIYSPCFSLPHMFLFGMCAVSPGCKLTHYELVI